MPRFKYNTKISIPDKVYPNILGFLATKYVESEPARGKNDDKGTIYYLGNYHTKAVRISPKRFFGLMKRKIELTDKVEQDIIDRIKNIINSKRAEK